MIRSHFPHHKSNVLYVYLEASLNKILLSIIDGITWEAGGGIFSPSIFFIEKEEYLRRKCCLHGSTNLMKVFELLFYELFTSSMESEGLTYTSPTEDTHSVIQIMRLS